jgi:hypothetical protein
MLMLALRTHPNVREIYRIGLITGAINRTPRSTLTPRDLTRMLKVLYPAVFDSASPWFDQINQKPSSRTASPNLARDGHNPAPASRGRKK